VQFINYFYGLIGYFNVESHMVGAGFGEALDKPGRLGYHQMAVENKVMVMLAEFGNNRRADCHIRYKVTVHNIQMHHLDPGRFYLGYLVGQLCKIAAQYGGYDLNSSGFRQP
jgi:hypothetical protein